MKGRSGQVNMDRALRLIDAALLAVRGEAIRRLQERDGGVIGLEIPLHKNGGVRTPKWWCRIEIDLE